MTILAVPAAAGGSLRQRLIDDMNPAPVLPGDVAQLHPRRRAAGRLPAAIILAICWNR
ncbi:hypothetical protein LOK46_27815 [Methylobacterium sp. NMS14P]|uniref:hypothetical protein n=1 Tax=Methylobacterium sp. NMS14P TaxID=2894310 RepID=UPI0023595660|nr:hypothetical protein [Methylobacterium sp. NMS14P]WCS24887.1 hypothetical protein LOK46_27815 [Methylobacterium sp. NMS14P]